MQEIYTSFFMRLILKIAKHEGYSYEIDPFDEDSICNDPTDLWSANCAVPEILFENERKFLEKFGFEIFDKAYSEFLIFPLSGGVIATKPTVNLPYFLLSLIDKFDDMLCKIAPKIFALQIRLVLKNMKKYD